MQKILFSSMVILASLGASVQAAEKSYLFDYESAIRSPFVTPVLDSSIRLVWDERDLPEYAERNDPDDYTRGSKFSGFPGSPNVAPAADKCMQAFAAVLAAMQSSARQQQYDVIFLHSDSTDATTGKKQFVCKQGYATNDVQLVSEFIVSKAFATKLALNPPEAVKPPPRKPSENVMTFPIASMLDTPDVKALLNSKMMMHWGSSNAPAYSKRYGPVSFPGKEFIKNSVETACKAAFVKTLRDMVESAQDDGYNAIIRIHSSLDDQPAPDESLFECRIVRASDADVSLTGVMAVLK